MLFKTNVISFWRMRFKYKLLFLINFVLCGVARASINLFSLKHLTPYFGQFKKTLTVSTLISDKQRRQACLIGKSVRLSAKYTPWDSNCLTQAMGAVLIQRDLFLLHGNAIKVGEHSVSFVGQSGAGKSTLAGAFFKQGYSILSDDICAVSVDGKVVPSFPQIKLWFDAAKHLNIGLGEQWNSQPT